MKNILIAMMLVAHAPMLQAAVATVITDSHLHSRPSTRSPVVTQLHSGMQVKTLLRSGGWKKIEVSKSKIGWVRSYQVRDGVIEADPQPESKKSGGFLAGLASLSRRASSLFSSNRRSSSSQRTATIGVRGLSEEQIKNAKPDFAQLARMESHRSSSKRAGLFARQGTRKAQQISHMPQSEREK